jgi:hypothetical protein
MPSAGPAPHPADPPVTDRAAAHAALIERQLAKLERLADIGMEIAEAAGRRAATLAESGEEGTDGPDPGLTYARAARAVRLTLALQARLARDLAALGEAATRAQAAEAARRRDRIHTRVERALEAERLGEDEVEPLSSDVWERLTEEDDEALLARPIDEVVALICADLGLSPAWAAPAFPRLGPAPQADADSPPPTLPAPPGTPAGPDPGGRAALAAPRLRPGGANGKPPTPSVPSARPGRPAVPAARGWASAPPRSPGSAA